MIQRKTFLTLAMAVIAGSFAIPYVSGAESPEINKLLADTKSQAVQLAADADSLQSFTRSSLDWQTYARQLDSMKAHINAAGKLLAQLKDAEATGEPWQQEAIRRIEPLLQDMADNTSTTIKYLDANKTKVHMQEFKDLCEANLDLANNLEGVIRDFVNFGNAKARYQELKEKLEL
ncbi:MAG TPA: hypothetical protein VHC90_24295 [Bryobacteraceae bacterium]|nr:hypothetical protein [Bryobacteraceae bacterium]